MMMEIRLLEMGVQLVQSTDYTLVQQVTLQSAQIIAEMVSMTPCTEKNAMIKIPTIPMDVQTLAQLIKVGIAVFQQAASKFVVMES